MCRTQISQQQEKLQLLAVELDHQPLHYKKKQNINSKLRRKNFHMR